MMNFLPLDKSQSINMCYISLFDTNICENFFEQLNMYNLSVKGNNIYEVVTNYGSIGYNILLSCLDNEQLYSLFWIPDTKFRWVLLNKNGNIIRKSRRQYSSKNECILKGKITTCMYNDVQVVIE